VIRLTGSMLVLKSSTISVTGLSATEFSAGTEADSLVCAAATPENRATDKKMAIITMNFFKNLPPCKLVFFRFYQMTQSAK